MKTLKAFDFPVRGESSYDWDKLLDGNIFQLEAGEDFDCKVGTFRMMANARAHKRGKILKSTVKTDEKTGKSFVIIQAEDATPEKIKHWEKLEAGRKERSKAKRAAAKANGDSGDEEEETEE